MPFRERDSYIAYFPFFKTDTFSIVCWVIRKIVVIFTRLTFSFIYFILNWFTDGVISHRLPSKRLLTCQPTSFSKIINYSSELANTSIVAENYFSRHKCASSPLDTWLKYIINNFTFDDRPPWFLIISLTHLHTHTHTHIPTLDPSLDVKLNWFSR